MVLELDSKVLYQSSEKKKRCCFVFPSSTKRENRMFHVVVAQRRLRNVQKSVQSFCFANLTLLLFLPFSLLWMTVVHCFHLFVCLFVFFFPVIYCTKCTSDHKLMEVNFQFSIFNFLHAIKIVLGRTALFLKK